MTGNPDPIIDLLQNKINKSLEQLGSDQSNYEIRRRNIWLNFLILIATILGLSSVFSSLNIVRNLFYWKIAWIVMIFAEIYGIIMVILENETKKERDLVANLRSADMAEIEIMSKTNAINNEERIELTTAALNIEELSPGFEKIWTDEAKEIIRKNTPKLPFSKLLKKTRLQNKFFRWISYKIESIINVFYILVIFSFVALLLAVMLS